MKSLSIFRSAFNTVGKRYSLLTITTLVMAAGVFIYYFYFLTTRADALDQRQYRILNRIENQLRTNLEGFKNLALAQTDAAIQVIERTAEDSELLSELKSKDAQTLNQFLQSGLDSVSFLKKAKADSGNVKLKKPYASEKEVNLKKSTVVSSHDSLVDSLLAITVTAPLTIKGFGTHAATLDFRVSVGSLIRPLLRHDMFDEFIVLRENKIVYETQASGQTVFLPDTSSSKGDITTTERAVPHIVRNGINYRIYRVGFSAESETGWAIVGLISEERFVTEKRTVPRAYLFAVFLVVVFIVLSVPFIKSLIMSRTERLGSTDVIFSAISLALTTSIVSVLLLDGYLRIDLDADEQGQQLKELSTKVEENLLTETHAVVSELQAYISHVQNPDTTRGDTADSDPEFLYYAEFNNLFLVDTLGLTRHDRFEPGLSFNVSNRKYVKNVLAGRCMKLKGLDVPFYLDAIISWREQQFRGVISIPLDSGADSVYKAAVMTMRLKSLTDPLLPNGTGFCLFDNEGNVFFHSDSTRALNENFLEECEDDATLKGSLTGRTSATIDLEYSGTPYMVHVRPVANLPYFIATFSQRGPVDAIHGQVFGMSFVLQILLFAFYIVVILLGMILVRRKSRLRLSLLELSAFAPDVNGLSRYVGAYLFNLLHGILIVCVVPMINEPLAIVLLFFICAPYTILLNMVQLSGSTLLSFISGHKRKLFALYAICILAANIIAAVYIDAWWVLALAQVIIVGIFLIIEQRVHLRRMGGLFRFVENRNTYKTAYSRLIFVLVILTCVIPAACFSVVTFNKEKEIQVKTVQLQVMQKLIARGTKKTTGMYALSSYYNPFFSTEKKERTDLCANLSEGKKLYDEFSARMRQLIQNSGEKYNRLRFGASDSLWQWCYSSGNNDSLIITSIDPFSSSTASGFQLRSAVPFFKLPFFCEQGADHTGRFWAALITAVIVLYFVLRFFVSKVFVNEKYSRTRSLDFDQTFFKNMTPDYKAFVTGMPSAGKSAYFREKCKGHKNIYTIDFVADDIKTWNNLLSDALKNESAVVILDHFEHDLLDETKTNAKLELIEQLVAARNKRVVIISSVQPAVFLNMMDRTSEDDEKSARLHERWNRVLAAFYDFIFPLQGYNSKQYSISTEYKLKLQPGEKLAIPDRLVRLVESECDNGTFLRTIGMELIDELHKRSSVYISMNEEEEWKEREDIIVRIQKLAENYYRSIWNHLAVEEQFVLFDLAQDGLVNSKNLDVVEELIDKGMIIYHSQLRLVNRSFRNFILCVVGPSDLGKLEQEVRNSGAWSKLKLPLFLVVGAMLLFVVKSDRSQLFGYFTAITALIPAVVGIISFFGYSGKKE